MMRPEQKSQNILSKILSNLIRDERGQSTTEYILILFVVVMIAVKFKSTIGTKIEKLVGDLGGKIDEATN